MHLVDVSDGAIPELGLPEDLCLAEEVDDQLAEAVHDLRLVLELHGAVHEAEDLHHAFHLLLSAKLNTTQAVDRIKEEITNSPEVSDLLRFIEASQRGVTK